MGSLEGSEGSDLGPQPGIPSLGIRISSFMRDQRSGCIIFAGSGTKICYAFGIKDQEFGYRKGISDEETHFIMTLTVGKGAQNSRME